MNALSKAQFEWDNRHPVEIPDGEAERIWIENATHDLLRGADVRFQRFGRQAQGVSYEQFANAVDEHLSALLIESAESGSALGRMYLAARRGATSECKSIFSEAVPDDQVLRNIATNLLSPLAADGVIADAEDAAS